MANQTVICSECGTVDIYSIPSRVCTQDTPDLAKKVYDRTLFDHECPNCGRKSLLDFNVHFTDRKHDLTLVYNPNRGATIDGLLGKDGKLLRMDDFLRDLTEQRFREGHKRPACRIVLHRLQFYEKATLFKHNLDDKVAEAMKQAAVVKYQQDFPEKEVSLSVFDITKTGYEIVVLDPEGKALSIPVKKSDYKKVERSFHDQYGNIDPYEVYIDAQWAAKRFPSYRKEEE